MKEQEQLTITKQSTDVIDGAKLQIVEKYKAMLPVEMWQEELNKYPDPSTLKSRDGVRYVPISHIEALLDTLFFGLWSLENFKYQVVANEICAQIELKVYHPIMGVWITRTGVGAAMIRQKSGAAVTDVSAKIKNALEMDLAHAKADAMKNAAKSLGKIFGRDLARKKDQQGKPRAMVKSKALEAKKKKDLAQQQQQQD